MKRRAWRYRRFEAEGCNLQKLIRQAAEEGITLTRMRRPSAKKLVGRVNESDAECLAEAGERGGWRVTLGQAVGAAHVLAALRRRWLPLTCALAALCAAGVALQLVWSVQIVDAGAYEADVRAYLAKEEIRPFRWRSEIDTAALKEAIEWRYPRIAWAECGWRGTALTVRLIRGVPMVTPEEYGPCDLVAKRGGVVTSVIALAGTPQVKAGQVVSAGDVLIAGEERTVGGETRQVAARGRVMARVWDAASVRMSLWETDTVYTGRTQTVQIVTCPLFDLTRREPDAFTERDKAVTVMPLGGLYLPFFLRTETRMEAEHRPQKRDPEETRAQAGLAALRRLRERVEPNEIFVDKWVDYSMIEDDYLSAEAVGERIVDLARRQKRASAEPS